MYFNLMLLIILYSLVVISQNIWKRNFKNFMSSYNSIKIVCLHPGYIIKSKQLSQYFIEES